MVWMCGVQRGRRLIRSEAREAGTQLTLHEARNGSRVMHPTVHALMPGRKSALQFLERAVGLLAAAPGDAV